MPIFVPFCDIDTVPSPSTLLTYLFQSTVRLTSIDLSYQKQNKWTELGVQNHMDITTTFQ